MLFIIYVNEIVTKLFQGHKFKPDGFHLWTMEPGPIFHTITQRTVILDGQENFQRNVIGAKK